MTLGGWIFMATSWLVILALFGFSMYRTLRRRPPPDDDDKDKDQRTSADGRR